MSLWGGDTLVYRSILALSLFALPVIAGVNFLLRDTPSWPQLGLVATLLVTALACQALSDRGKRDIAAALLVGMIWCAATIYAITSGYGMHSAAVFLYLPCLLYTTLFFGVAIASIELGLTTAALILMYFGEESGRLIGAAGFPLHGTNFNFLVGAVLTCAGTLVIGAVYHRRVESEAARVVAGARQRQAAMEQARLAQAQLETANGRLKALNEELAARGRRHELETVRARRDLDLFHDVAAKDLPVSLQALRAALAAPDERTEEKLRREIDRLAAISTALAEIGQHQLPALTREPVDLSTLARDAVKSLRGGGRFARVRFDVEPGMHAACDRQLLAALLRHLVRRAAASCLAEPEAVVHVGSGSHDGKPVFFVSDNGPAMDEALRQKLFRPFGRGEGEDDTVDIGIVSARRIAEQHGGELSVESAPGHGTRYFFTLTA